MSRPFTRAQARQNTAFLSLLRRTGNARLAAREVGLAYSTMQDRRRKHPAFAARWDAALVFFAARLGKKGKQSFDPSTSSGQAKLRTSGNGAGLLPPQEHGSSFRTSGGEPVLRRTRNGKLQLQRAPAGRLTPAAEQAFLSAVSVTCNMSLAAAAVGACFGAFNKRRKKDPAFARELRLALRQGYEALEMGLVESRLAASFDHDAWRTNDPPAMPPMSVAQALQLLYLHQKAALLVEEPTAMRRRRGESHAACCERLTLMSEARDARAREAFEVAEAERWARGEPAWGLAGEAVRASFDTGLRLRSAAAQDGRNQVGLPDLAQVTGWSRADPAKAADAEAPALFGGWRIEDMEAKRRRDVTK